MRVIMAERGVGQRGKLRLLGIFFILVVIIAALMAIPAIWAH